jgi:hypothetical protein
MGTNALFVAFHLDEKDHGVEHLPTHVPSTMPNKFDGVKKKIFTM